MKNFNERCAKEVVLGSGNGKAIAQEDIVLGLAQGSRMLLRNWKARPRL
jgi:hypothetical protein